MLRLYCDVRSAKSKKKKKRMNSFGKVENVVGGPSAERHARKELNVARNSRFEAVEE